MSYPPIYVISLKRTPERKLYMQRQLDALNLNYRFIEAIDKYDLAAKTYRMAIASQLEIDESIMEDIYIGFTKGPHGSGGFGCLLSHIKVYNLMIKENISKACVLEDDARLLPVFPKILVASQKVPWDILMLYHSSNRTRDTIISPLLFRKSQVEREKIRFDGEVRFKREKIRFDGEVRFKLDISNFCRHLYKLVCYKKYYPYLNLHTFLLIISKVSKYLSLKMSIKPFNLMIGKFDVQKIAREIGALPVQDKRTWYKATSNYYIARAYRDNARQYGYSILSCIAYMVTQSAAIKWRNAAIMQEATEQNIDLLDRYPLPIDSIRNRVVLSTGLNYYICTPSCVSYSNQYQKKKWRVRIN